MKMKKIGPRGGEGGACPKFYYVDPPLILYMLVVSDNYDLFQHFYTRSMINVTEHAFCAHAMILLI